VLANHFGGSGALVIYGVRLGVFVVPFAVRGADRDQRRPRAFHA